MTEQFLILNPLNSKKCTHLECSWWRLPCTWCRRSCSSTGGSGGSHQSPVWRKVPGSPGMGGGGCPASWPCCPWSAPCWCWRSWRTAGWCPAAVEEDKCQHCQRMETQWWCWSRGWGGCCCSLHLDKDRVRKYLSNPTHTYNSVSSVSRRNNPWE